MPQISKRPINKKLAKEIQLLLTTTFTQCKNEAISSILEDVLTPTERMMVAKRLAIALLLYRGWDQESIDRTLKVSIATIQTVKRSMENSSQGYHLAINKINSNAQSQQSLESLINLYKKTFTLKGQIRALNKSELSKEGERAMKPKIL